MMRALIILGCATLLMQSTGKAQVTMEDFLASALMDEEYLMNKAKNDYLSTKPYRLSPLQKTELRIKNRELNETYQAYGLRLSPANPWEMRNNSQYFRAVAALASLESEEALKDALRYRYTLLIELLTRQLLLALSETKLSNIQSQIRIATAYPEKIDVAKFVSLQAEMTEQEHAVADQAEDLKALVATINNLQGVAIMSGNTILDDLISIEEIKNVLASDVDTAMNSLPLALAIQRQKVEISQREYKLDKSNINIGFAQAEYDNRRSEQGRTPVNLSFGIAIPLTNPNKAKLAKDRLKIIEEEYALKKVSEEQHVQVSDLLRALEVNIKQYELLSSRLDVVTTRMKENIKNSVGGEPWERAQIDESVTSIKYIRAKQYQKVLDAYIEYLFAKDKLQEKPLVNYLSKGLKSILK